MATVRLLLLLLLPCVLAAQPSLPTVVQGQVMGSMGFDTVAMLSFSDSEGVQRTVEAPLDNGMYVFNKGYVQAPAGTMIVISIAGATTSVTANPGGVAIAPTIQLGSGGVPETYEDSGYVPGAQGGDSDASSGNTGDTREGSGEGDAGDTSDSGSFGEQESEASGDTSANGISEETGRGQVVPDIPTTVYGQLLDEEGSPRGGETVSAEWTDRNNFTHNKNVTTFTAEEAEEMGNASLEGFYSFQDIDAEPGTNITVTDENATLNETVQAAPGEQRLAGTVNAVQQQRQSQRSDDEQNVVPQESTARALTENLLDNWVYIVIVLFIVLSVPMVLLIRRELLYRETHPKGSGDLGSRLRHMRNNKLRGWVNRDINQVNANDSIKNVFSSFLAANTSHAFIMDGKCARGLLTDTDILQKVDFLVDPLEKVRVRDVMTAPVQMLAKNASFHDAVHFVLETDNKIVCLGQDRELFGFVTIGTLMDEYDRFFSVNQFDRQNLPHVKNSMREAITVQEDVKLDVLLSIMKRENATTVVVTHKRISEGREVEEIRGIVTERELLEELYNYQGIIKKMDAGRVMRRNVKGIHPGATIFEANSVMIERDLNVLPVLIGSEVVGVLTRKEVIAAMNSFFNYLQKGRTLQEMVNRE